MPVAADPTSALVSTDWLAEHLRAPDIRIVDASWYLPGDSRDPKAEYDERHIPGAVYFDIDDVADDQSDLPHMVPSAAKFSSRVRKLGLGDGNRIVVYDANGFWAAARVWWMFRLFGHEDVAVLDGGLGKWIEEDRDTESMTDSRTERHFTARQNNLLLRELEDIRGNITNKRETLIDVRSPARFRGEEQEPRPGVRQGHIPGSVNLHYGRLVAEDGRLRSREDLAALFAEIGVDPSAAIAMTCGSGVTACIGALALYELGNRQVAVYDGSWTEWGGRPDTPVVRPAS